VISRNGGIPAVDGLNKCYLIKIIRSTYKYLTHFSPKTTAFTITNISVVGSVLEWNLYSTISGNAYKILGATTLKLPIQTQHSGGLQKNALAAKFN